MRKSKSLYIEVLRLGVKNQNEGISFNEVKDHINKSRFKTDGIQGYLCLWFYLNFYHPQRTRSARGTVEVNNPFHDFGNGQTDKDDDKCILMADGYMQYMEWVELEQARISSRRAMYVAITAISISGALAYLSLAYQINWFPFC